ncbi:hypothetical protein [Priestia aryabhattai]
MKKSSFFEKDIAKIAEVLLHQKEHMPGCTSLEDAWDRYMHPLIKAQATFDEVINYINNK